MKKLLTILELILLYLGATMTGGLENLVTGGLALVIVVLRGIAFVSSMIFKSKAKLRDMQGLMISMTNSTINSVRSLNNKKQLC